MNEEEKQILEQEIRDERNRESIMTHYDCWLEDNKRYLKDEFVSDNPDLFAKYCQEQYDNWGND